MIAMLLMAQIAAAQPPAPLVTPRSSRCDMWLARPVDFKPPALKGAPGASVQSLAQMPPADEHLLVLRRDAQGCSVPVIVRYSVHGDGTFATGATGK